MDADHLLWEDRAPYELRFEKSAAALVAVERALRHDPRIPGARTVLDAYASAESASSDLFGRVWGAPSAYHWVRRAVPLLAARHGAPLSAFDRAYSDGLGASTLDDAIERHLGAFAKFALGLGLVGGHDVALATPWETSLPLAIPGTDVAVVGSVRTALTGVRKGEIELVDEAGRPRVARLERCPVVTVGHARVVLNPYV